jgi:hypothetical protein
MRLMLSPRAGDHARDAYLDDPAVETTVRLDEHREDSQLDELDLDEQAAA